MTNGIGGSPDEAPGSRLDEGAGNDAGAPSAGSSGGDGAAGTTGLPDPATAGPAGAATTGPAGAGPAGAADVARPAGGAAGVSGSASDAIRASLADRVNADLAADLAAAAVDIGLGNMTAAETDLAAAVVDEDLQLATVARERDEYLDALRRLQADFENYKKRVVKQQIEQVDRAAEALVNKLLPVCDTADLAIAHGGGEEVKQVWTALFDALEHEGLERIDPVGVPFDPTVHEAVAHEPSDGNAAPEVVEVMRAGYRWKGRVVRPAMVKVRG
jgi:molecular chaperone GrpE